MAKLFGGTIHSALVHAATAFDRKAEEKAARNPRAYHNHYALAQYLMRIDQVTADIGAGAKPHDAIVAAFSGPLRTTMLKAIGDAADHRETGAVFYTPIAAR